MKNDPFGRAIKDYFENGSAPDIQINTNYTEDESIPVSYFFRGLNEMPKMEQRALQLCSGKILDIGAAAGCHSLLLQQANKSVTALEISKLAAEVLIKRGVKNVVCENIYNYTNQPFDTLLLLMNGTGLGGNVVGLKKLLLHLKSLLNDNGQILIDSSDIKYLFEEEDGSVWMDINNPNYYGEMQYEVRYKNSVSDFNWLFIDFNKLKQIAKEVELKIELIYSGEHYEYLAKLRK